jgi:hypothetical protein
MSEGDRPKDAGPVETPPAAVPPAAEGAPPPREESRERRPHPILEGAVADMVRRGLEAGWDRLSKGERGGAIRAALGEMRLPKEIAQYIGSQLDDTKNAILKVVSKELREFLETSHFADELARLLTTLQFEMSTTVRFVPNAEGKPPRPRITAQSRLRRRKTDE